MTELSIFEPAMCCETGVCGVDADTVLINFTADIDWLRKQGLSVQRFNLAQEPAAFIGNPIAKAEINAHGESCLPLIIMGEKVLSRGQYPDRNQLKAMSGMVATPNTSTTPGNAPKTTRCGCGTGSSC